MRRGAAWVASWCDRGGGVDNDCPAAHPSQRSIQGSLAPSYLARAGRA